MTKSNKIPTKPIELNWDCNPMEGKESDCGVGSSADMPHEIWIVLRCQANHHGTPIAAFCNQRYAQFWIKNRPEEDKKKYSYLIYPGLGNPECNESIE